MLKVIVVENWRQYAKIRIIQSFDGGITITRVEMVVAPNMNFVRRGILLKSVAKLGSGSSGTLVGRNMSQSLALLRVTTRVVGTPQLVFTNLIMIIHVNKTVGRPSVNSMVVGGYKSANVVYPRGGYQKPSIVIAKISNHKNGHYVRPNRVAINILI